LVVAYLVISFIRLRKQLKAIFYGTESEQFKSLQTMFLVVTIAFTLKAISLDLQVLVTKKVCNVFAIWILDCIFSICIAYMIVLGIISMYWANKKPAAPTTNAPLILAR
jgi:hypothetical protein